jgi:hypothetical protein
MYSRLWLWRIVLNNVARKGSCWDTASICAAFAKCDLAPK